jgi:Kef-type K+ transport system membrane component KefB
VPLHFSTNVTVLPEVSHPRYPVKLAAIGFGLLIPVFFVTKRMTLDVKSLVENPSALAGRARLGAAVPAAGAATVGMGSGDTIGSEPNPTLDV